MRDVDRVFGGARGLPASYVPVGLVDDAFQAALEGDRHFVVWGEPKQGKSSLIRRHIPPDDCCVVQCTYGQKRYDVYRMLLRGAGASVAVEHRLTKSRGIGASVSLLSGKASNNTETTEQAIEIDISNVNDVLTVLAELGFARTVVIEDFHYLRRSTQRNLLQDLKVVFEKSTLRVVLVGVWADRRWLRSLPGDLASPLQTVEVPRWSNPDLAQVLKVGSRELNVTIGSDVAAGLIRNAHHNVGLLQDLAAHACRHIDPSAGQGLDDIAALDQATDAAMQSSVARLRWYLSTLSHLLQEPQHQPGFQRYVSMAARENWHPKPLSGIIHALLVAPDDDREDGLSLAELQRFVTDKYPRAGDELSHHDVLYGLDQITRIQRKLRVSPVVGYDASSERLQVVDPLARLFLSVTDNRDIVRLLPNEGRPDLAERVIVPPRR